MIKVFIAEDIEIVLENIINHVRAFTLQLEVCGTATDGISALEKIEALKPDILITDIRMPKMDGIRLIEAVKKINPKMKFIILSGYAEFEYARESLKLKVSEYLLKPLKNEELYAAFQRVIEEIEMEQKQSSSEEQSRILEKDKKLIKTENLLTKLLFTGYSDWNVHTISEEIGLDTQNTHLVFVIVHLSGSTDGKALKDQDLASVWLLAKNAINTICENRCTGIIIPNAGANSEISLLLMENNGNKLRILAKTIACEIFNKIKTDFGITATIGIGSMKKGLHNAKQAFEEAGKALESRFINGLGKTYPYKENEYPETKQPVVFKLQYSTLEKCLEEKDCNLAVKSCRNVIEGIFSPEKLRQHPDISISLLFSETMMKIVNYGNKLGLELSGLVNDDVHSGKILSTFDNCDDINLFILDFVRKIIDLKLKNLKDGSFNIDVVKDHMDKNFMENLSLSDIAIKFSVSPKYLSDTFKKKYGINFVEYLNTSKIESAKKLLKETSLNIDHISETLGFNSRFYFFKVFRKYTGTTPQEYRNK